MEFDFLNPIPVDLLIDLKNLSSQHLANKVVFHTQEEFPDLDKVKIAIVGVLDNRGAGLIENTVDLTAIRQEFYSLFPGNWQHTLADLGDILPGETIEDTYFAVQKVINLLLKKNIVPIVIGGSQDLTYPLYRAYDTLEQMVNLVVIDSKFDLEVVLFETPRNFVTYKGE